MSRMARGRCRCASQRQSGDIEKADNLQKCIYGVAWSRGGNLKAFICDELSLDLLNMVLWGIGVDCFKLNNFGMHLVNFPWI
jgi:hypothetical protein